MPGEKAGYGRMLNRPRSVCVLPKPSDSAVTLLAKMCVIRQNGLAATVYVSFPPLFNALCAACDRRAAVASETFCVT